MSDNKKPGKDKDLKAKVIEIKAVAGVIPADETPKEAAANEEFTAKPFDFSAKSYADAFGHTDANGKTNFYYQRRYGPTSDLLFEVANKAAEKIFGTYENYNKIQQHRLSKSWNNRYNSAYHNSGEQEPATPHNENYFSRHKYAASLLNLFNIGYPQSPVSPGFVTDSVSYDVRRVIDKLKRAEERYSEDELFGSELRERIIESVIIPPPEAPGAHQYRSSVHLNPFTNAETVGAKLSSEDYRLILETLNYVPRLRNLSVFVAENNPQQVVDNILQKTDLDKLWFNSVSANDQALLFIKRIDDMAFYLGQVVDRTISDDLIFTGRSKAFDLYAERNKIIESSTELRDCSVKYVTGQRTVSDLLKAVVKFAEANLKYRQEQINILDTYFVFFNENGVHFDKFVEDSKGSFISDAQDPPF